MLENKVLLPRNDANIVNIAIKMQMKSCIQSMMFYKHASQPH